MAGIAALRDALGTDVFDELRGVGAEMTLTDLVELSEAIFAARQAGQPAPARSGPS